MGLDGASVINPDNIVCRKRDVEKFNNYTRFGKDGRIRLGIWNFGEEDGVYKLRETYKDMFPPSRTKDLFGNPIERFDLPSKYAPKDGTFAQKKMWALADLREHLKEAESKEFLYSLEVQQQEKVKESVRIYILAQSSIHPFEIFRYLGRIEEFLPTKPVEGEPAYLPPDLHAKCLSEFDRLQGEFMRLNWKSKGKSFEHLNPSTVPVHSLKFKDLPNVVPGGVYLSINPKDSQPAPPAGTCRVNMSSSGFDVDNAESLSIDAQIALSEWIKKAARNSMYDNIFRPSPASGSATKSSPAKSAMSSLSPESVRSGTAATTASPHTISDAQPKSVTKPAVGSLPKPKLATNYDDWFAKVNTTTKQASSVLKSVASKVASKVQADPATPKAKQVITFDGQRSEENAKTKPSTKPPPFSTARRLATPEEFLASVSGNNNTKVRKPAPVASAPAKTGEAILQKSNPAQVAQAIDVVSPSKLTNQALSEPVKVQSVKVESLKTEPVESKPIEVQSVKVESLKTEPVESKPIENKSLNPVENKLVKPVESKPVENKPIGKPFETAARPTQNVRSTSSVTVLASSSASVSGPKFATKTGVAKLVDPNDFMAWMSTRAIGAPKPKVVPPPKFNATKSGSSQKVAAKSIAEASPAVSLPSPPAAIAREPESRPQSQEQTTPQQSLKEPTVLPISSVSVVEVKSAGPGPVPAKAENMQSYFKKPVDFDSWFSQMKPIGNKVLNSHQTEFQPNHSTAAASVPGSGDSEEESDSEDVDSLAVISNQGIEPSDGESQYLVPPAAPIQEVFENNILAWVAKSEDEINKLPKLKVDTQDPKFAVNPRPVENGYFAESAKSASIWSGESESERQRELSAARLAFDAYNRAQHQTSLQCDHESKNHNIQIEEEHAPIANENSPLINIHLRPAVEADMEGLAEVYNFHVKNGTATEDLEEVTVHDMAALLSACREERLPLIVAVLGNAPKSSPAYNGESSYTGDASKTSTSNDKVVGFAFARPVSTGGLAKRVTMKSRCSAKLYTYVHGGFLRKRIGSCLLDRIHKCMSTSYTPYAEGTYQYVTSSAAESLYLDDHRGSETKDLTLLVEFQCQEASEYPESDERLAWLQNWLQQWGYEHHSRLPCDVRIPWGDEFAFLDTVTMIRRNDRLH